MEGFKVVTFGEVMLRLSTPGAQRFSQARVLDVSYGGGEANVAVSLANYGLRVDYVSRLPDNDLGEACLRFLRQYGVGVRFVARGGERIGIYFLETGAAQRGSQVIYDRSHSSFAGIQPGMVDWQAVFQEAAWFHFTGITPAISEGAAAACLEAVETASRMGVQISCDLNYRAKLWKWGKTAGEVMPALVEHCQVIIANEEDAEKVFGIQATQADVVAGHVQADHYLDVCQKLSERFPAATKVAITLRGSLGAHHNTWSAILWDRGEVFTAPEYDIGFIVDRVGGGDAFGAGLIFGLLQPDFNTQAALNFAVAASCLKHSIPGDFNLVSKEEVHKLMQGDASGRVSR